MINLKVPLCRNADGIEFGEIQRSWVPLMPISFYFGGELDGVKINRVIWNGKSIPEVSLDKLKSLPECSDYDVFDKIIPVDGDEIIVVPAFGEPFSMTTITGIAIGGMVYGIPTTIANMLMLTGASLLINGLLSSLIAPAKPKGQQMNNSATSYGWNGIQNTYGPGDPVPVCLGQHKKAAITFPI
jgi:hypothetical protein